MTQSNTNFRVQNLRFPRIFSMAIFSLILISSCTQKISFLTSSIVPAARGTVKVKMDDNKNHTIQIALVNLAEPERLTPPRKLYMVWMETDQGEIKTIGRIMTDSGTFSKTLKADFKTVTSFTPIKIFITAEEDANIQSPGWEVILTTAKF